MSLFHKHGYARTAGTRPWRVTPSRDEGKWDLRAAITGEIKATYLIRGAAEDHARFLNLRDGYNNEETSK